MRFTERVLCLSLVGWLTLTVSVQAQNPRKLAKKAEAAIFQDKPEEAIKLYEQAVALQPENPKYHYHLGKLYLEQNQVAKAMASLENAVKFSPGFNLEYNLGVAEGYQLTSQFDYAAAQYQLILDKTDKDKEEEIELYNKRLLECASGKMLKARPANATVSNLGSALNTAGDDMVPILTNDDNRMIFVSQRGSLGTKRENEDIFEATRTESGWSAPKAFGKPLNTANPDAVVYVTPESNTFYVFLEKNNGDIAEVTRTGPDSWSKPKLLDDPINSDDFEPSFYITKDKQFAFFASDRPEGYGGLDIYLTMRQPDGTWSEAMNLGLNVNTPYDEDAPFISEDGSTLFFSSRGHNSMGGYDIFRSSSLGVAWTAAENLGFPINSPYNDIYFYKTASGSLGYFTSDRAGGLGQKDIYEATFRNVLATDSISREPEPVVAVREPATPEPVVAKAEPITPPIKPVPAPEPPVTVSAPVKEADLQPIAAPATVFGRITDAATRKPIAAQITFKPKQPGNNALTAAANKKQGNYGAVISRGQLYEILIQAEGYFFVTENVTVPLKFSGDSLRRDFSLRKLTAGANLVLKNVFFEYNNFVLTPSSKAELDYLAALLKENPTIRVEISGHTDNRGKDAYNQSLSLKRAKSVIAYLVSKGIVRNRFEAVGHGASKPIATNETEAGRKKNRRTEFRVLTN